MSTDARHPTHRHPLRRRRALTGEDPQRGSLHARRAAGVLNMRWVRSTLDRISRFKESSFVQEMREPVRDFEGVRQAMLHLLGGVSDPRAARMVQRVCRAANAEALWYLRADLVGALAVQHGEEEAHKLVRRITRMLESQVPEGWHSRPSPLAE